MRFLFLVISIFISPMLTASPPVSVYYAGFSFVGNHADNAKAYPHSVALAKENGANGLPLIEQALLARMSKIERPDVNFIVNHLGDYRSGDAITLAFAIDWENVAVEKIADVYKVVVDLHGQILLFDYSEMKVIGSYPVAIQLRDVQNDEPSEEYIRSIIRALYLDDQYGINIVDEFSNRLKSVAIKPSFGQYLMVRNVVLEEKAVKHMPSTERLDQSIFKTTVAQSFGKYLSLNQGVSLLPYTVGEAIGSKMALRFSNGDVFNLLIPEPDFTVDLIIRGFKKVKIGETHAKTAWVYGSYLRIHIEQPDFGKVYMDIPFKNAAIKKIPVSQVSVDDWTAYQESLYSFFNQFSSQVSSPSKKWIAEVTKAKDASKQFSAVNKILEKTR